MTTTDVVLRLAEKYDSLSDIAMAIIDGLDETEEKEIYDYLRQQKLKDVFKFDCPVGWRYKDGKIFLDNGVQVLFTPEDTQGNDVDIFENLTEALNFLISSLNKPLNERTRLVFETTVTDKKLDEKSPSEPEELKETTSFVFYDKSGNPIGFYVEDNEKLTEEQLGKMTKLVKATDNSGELVSWKFND